jgi:hypothetical protein
MLRRSFLTAAAAAPALYSARSLAGPAGSSVAPIGTQGGTWCPTTHYWDGDGCVAKMSWVGNKYPQEWLGMVNVGRIAVGSIPVPPRPFYALAPEGGMPDDSMMRTLLTGNEYSDWQDLAGMIAIGEGAGLLIGRRYGGSRGAMAGAAAGVGAAFLLWFGYNLGVFINKQRTTPSGFTDSLPRPSQGIERISYNDNSWQWSSTAGAYGGGFSYGWSFCPVGGGGDHILNHLY